MACIVGDRKQRELGGVYIVPRLRGILVGIMSLQDSLLLWGRVLGALLVAVIFRGRGEAVDDVRLIAAVGVGSLGEWRVFSRFFRRRREALVRR
jgi:hypothetical protein